MGQNCFKFAAAAVMMMAFCLMSVRSFTTPERQNFLDEPPHYHTDDEVSDKFARLAKQYPDLARVHSLGQSIEGRDLIIIEISRNVRQRGLLVPMFKYVANMHGDETIGREMLIYLAEYLLLNYNVVPEVTRLVDTTDIFLMPSMNPDGFNRSTVSWFPSFSVDLDSLFLSICSIAITLFDREYAYVYAVCALMICCFFLSFRSFHIRFLSRIAFIYM